MAERPIWQEGGLERASLSVAIRAPKRASGIVAGWAEQKVIREISNAFGAV